MNEIYTENILNKARDKSFDILHVDGGGEAAASVKILSNYIFGHGTNPSCGDIGEIYFLLEKNKNKLGENTQIVKDVKLKKEGCAISQAGLVILAEKVMGMEVSNLKRIVPGDIYNMLGVNISPSRAGCALLCYNALEDFLKKI